MLSVVLRLAAASLIFAPAVFGQGELGVGRKIFEAQCALCHGQTGMGGRGPGLNRPSLAHAPDDESLRNVISNGISPEMPGAWQLHEHEVSQVAAYVRSLGRVPPEAVPGDAKQGEALYASKGCAGCHMVRGKGEGYGPELTDIGARRNAAYLRETLIEPAKSMPEDFLMVEASTAAGRTVRGVRANEDTFSIQIRDAAGKYYSFRKSELKQLRKLNGQTTMPSFRDALNASELDDVVAYLAGLRGRL
jgi:cytochrome c oxidase cbb3-type subunit 3